jgi:hypothetical protein
VRFNKITKEENYMKVAICKLESTSPISFGRYHNTPKKDKESHDEYEKRTWRERVHVNDKEFVVIPPMMFKNCLSGIGKFLREKIPGKGNSEFTAHLKAGVMITDELNLGVKKNKIEGEWLFVPANGKPGGPRVPRCFPLVRSWKGTVKFYILDEVLLQKDSSGRPAFEHHLEEAGKFLGLGRFRPERGGFYGRFKVVKVTYIDE